MDIPGFSRLSQDNNFLKVLQSMTSHSSLGNLNISELRILIDTKQMGQIWDKPWQTADPPHWQLSSLPPCQTRQGCLHLATTWSTKHVKNFSPQNGIFCQKICGLGRLYLTCVAGPYPLSLRAAILIFTIKYKATLLYNMSRAFAQCYIHISGSL